MFLSTNAVLNAVLCHKLCQTRPVHMPALIDDTGRIAALGSSTIAHMDLDCFYVAVERRINPSLRGQPIGLCQWSQQLASSATKSFEEDGTCEQNQKDKP